MSQLIEAHQALQKEFLELSSHWNMVRGQWRDNVALQFEKEHWQPSVQVIDNYLRTLDDLTDVLDRAENSLD